MKKIALVCLLVVSFPFSVYAVDRKTEAQRMREEFRQIVSTRASEIRAKKQARALFSDAVIESVDENMITATTEGKTYIVTVTEDTKLRRRYFGESNLDEFAAGQHMFVIGVFSDDARTQIDAKYIRNLSIMKRFGVFIGDVSAISGNQITIDTVARGVQSATVDDTTEYVNRNMESIPLADFAVGHRVRIKGLWDKENKTIKDVTQIKDFSLPPRPTE